MPIPEYDCGVHGCQKNATVLYAHGGNDMPVKPRCSAVGARFYVSGQDHSCPAELPSYECVLWIELAAQIMRIGTGLKTQLTTNCVQNEHGHRPCHSAHCILPAN
eukprot:84677-Pelagomonas_calceolata.AAC.2